MGEQMARKWGTSGQKGHVKYHIACIGKNDGSGDFFKVRFWDREYVWQGKNCRDQEFSVKNLQSLKEAIDEAIETVMRYESEAAERASQMLFNAEIPKEHDLPSGLDKNCNTQAISFDDDDIPF